jgi:putative transcriptional regulator
MSDPARPLSLKGALLLADATLQDPYFEHSVVLLTAHQREQGATGFVLNKPFGKRIGEMIPKAEFAALKDVEVFIGGPVGGEHLIFAAMHWRVETRRLVMQTHLSAEDAIARQEQGETIRAFLGYSGWSRGQLEQEIRENAWQTRAPVARVMEPTCDDRLWRELYRSLGPLFELKALGPKFPSQN